MDTFPDLGSLSDQELKDLIQQLTEEEVEVSYRRRLLHGKIDILRAELVNRLRKKHDQGLTPRRVYARAFPLPWRSDRP